MRQARNATLDRIALTLAMLGVVTGSMFLAGACSFKLDTSVTQCQSDYDCTQFAGAVCDVTNRVCVARRDASVGTANASAVTNADASVVADAAQSCVGPSGCFSCSPTNESQILSHCTDTVCVPFDNKRLTLMADDGALRPLP